MTTLVAAPSLAAQFVEQSLEWRDDRAGVGGVRAVKFIDVTVRDGQQSLWATRMRNDMFLPILARMDEVGFEAIDLVGGAVFDVCVRYLREDPWERMRLAAERCRRTPLNVWSRGQSLFTFELFPDDIVELAVRTCARQDIKRFTCYDALNDTRNIALSVRVAKESGMTASGQVVYNVSPVHSDEYFGRKAKEIVALGADTLGLKDPSGLLTPERARTLIPVLREVAGERPLEVHTHCRSGLGELALVEAVQLGTDIVHTGVRPLASGDALPDCRYVVGRLRELGFEVGLEDEALADMEKHFIEVAIENDKPFGQPLRYDPFLYFHQVPGGMISNLRSQLSDLGMEHRLREVLEEAGRVREDLGYPILVSPFAQFVVTQAVINVVTGSRYANIPDEVARYVLGYYGEVAGPVDPTVRERVEDMTGESEAIRARPGELVPPRLDQLRRERGRFQSDGDLLLAAFYKPAQLDPFLRQRSRSSGRPERGARAENAKRLLEQVRAPFRARQLSVRQDGVSFEARA